MTNFQHITDHISRASGERFTPDKPHPISGGCINSAVQLSDGKRSYFIKLNDSHRLDMFMAESDGLNEIAATETLRVPHPLCHGTDGNQAYLVMEYIELGRTRSGTDEEAGRQLAAMHRTSAGSFGWKRDNTIGSTPQLNQQCNDWAQFWQEQRLGFQLELAAHNGHGGRLTQKGEKLLALFPALINHNPTPSLLHGDLWGGNMACDSEGHPVIYDPAVYYGDREADLAMTELFSGFGSDFYAAYKGAWPLDAGYSTRKALYNLYHILNHLNLFGGGYLKQAEEMIDQLLAELH